MACRIRGSGRRGPRVARCRVRRCRGRAYWATASGSVRRLHPDEVAARYLKLWPSMPVLYNAERGIWPRADLADRFPECGTPWRYLNCGLMIGPPKDMLKVLDWMDLDGIPGDCFDP